MAVNDLNGNIKDKIFETFNDVTQSIEQKLREIKAVMGGKSPEQVEVVKRRKP